MLRVQGSLRVHTFSSAACVHNVESSDDDGGGGGGDSDPSTRCSAVLHSSKKASRKEIKKMVRKILSSVRRRHHTPQVSRSHSEAAGGDGDATETGGGQSDRETFVSAKCSEVCSLCTDDDEEDSELPSFRLSPSIFPAGGTERQSQPTACPMRVIMKLPFGFIVGRQLHAPAAIMPSMKLSLNLKKMVPKLADLQLQFRSKMIKTKVVCAIKERFGRGGSRRGEGSNSYRNGNVDGDDEDVFWKKDVRGLRCRRVEDSDSSY
ncbi:hypothetical protein ABZP36_001749 [Zizania latifolia]